MNTALGIKRRWQGRLIEENVRASSLIPVVAFDEESKCFLMDDGTLGVAFSCTPSSYASEQMEDRLQGFLNQAYPENSIMSFTLFKSPDIYGDLARMKHLRMDYNDQLMRDVMGQRMSFMEHHSKYPIITKTSRGQYNLGTILDQKLIVTFKIPIAGARPTPEELERMEDLAESISSGLQTAELQPRQINAKTYIRLMETMLNWSKDATWRNSAATWDEGKPINEQIFDYDTDITVQRNGMTLGDKHLHVLSAKRLPDAIYFGEAIRFIGDLSGAGVSVRESYMITVNVFMPSPEKTKSVIDRKRQFATNQAFGPMLKFVRALGEKYEGYNQLDKSLSAGFKPVKISYSMAVFADTEEQVIQASTALRNLWREQRFDIMNDSFAMLPCFINMLPLCADHTAITDTFRYKTMTTEHATALLPVFGEWKGTGTYHTSLMSRNGQMMSFSLHDSNTNKNAVICAESGSGKSFLVNELVMSYLSEGAQIWIIDVGRSYEKLCEVIGGDFIHFAESTNTSLNPFGLIEETVVDIDEETGEEITVDGYEAESDALFSIVSAMASESGVLCEFQKAVLKQIMQDVWNKHKKNMLIDHIAEACNAHNDQRIKDVGVQLYSFTSNGSYGKYFSRPSNINFKNRFTVLELDDLQGRKHLRQVVLLQLIFQVGREIFLGERGRKKLLIIDEAWDLLKDGEVAVFMEHAYRKFRKYGGSAVIATQSVNDLYENPVGRAIAENSSSLLLLGQTEETVESIRRTKRLELPDSGYEMLKGVHTILGAYSEIFVKSNAGVGIGRLVVGDYQKLLYSTDPVDIAAINYHKERGMTTTDAIRAVLEERAR